MTCKYCGAETKWPEPYVKGALMINADGSEHRCKGKVREPQLGDKSREMPTPNTSAPETPQPTLSEAMQKPAEAFDNPTPQAKDFDEMQLNTLFDDGHTRALRKQALLRGIRNALPDEDAPVIGMIFNQICADLRL